jgi:hypothetical protein
MDWIERPPDAAPSWPAHELHRHLTHWIVAFRLADGRELSGVLDLVAADRIDLDTSVGPQPVDVSLITAYAIVSEHLRRD